MFNSLTKEINNLGAFFFLPSPIKSSGCPSKVLQIGWLIPCPSYILAVLDSLSTESSTHSSDNQTRLVFCHINWREWSTSSVPLTPITMDEGSCGDHVFLCVFLSLHMVHMKDNLIRKQEGVLCPLSNSYY